MAVLIEALCVVVKVDTVERTVAGGWTRFVTELAGPTLLSDTEIARVAFVDPGQVEAFVARLGTEGLRFAEDGRAIDVAVVEQGVGLTLPCDWLVVVPAALPDFGNARVTVGHLAGSQVNDLVYPTGWRYEGSASERFPFPSGALGTSH